MMFQVMTKKQQIKVVRTSYELRFRDLLKAKEIKAAILELPDDAVVVDVSVDDEVGVCIEFELEQPDPRL